MLRGTFDMSLENVEIARLSRVRRVTPAHLSRDPRASKHSCSLNRQQRSAIWESTSSACATAPMFHFTPLLGAQSDSPACQSLLELDNGIKILVDVGWDETFDVGMLIELERLVILWTSLIHGGLSTRIGNTRKSSDET